MNTALVRAKMCQALAEAKKLPATETSFTVGLLSILDVLMQSPLEHILESLPLSEEISGALLNYEGLLGRILSCTLAYERCDWDNLDMLELPAEQISDIYMDALSDAYRAAYEML
jgi:EAL and modified HD-GYP domain-containing signal transduction protein